MYLFFLAKIFEFIIEKLSGPAPNKLPGKMDSTDIILVAGATGGVGRRVVDILRKKGLPVRALVCFLTDHWLCL